MTDVLEYLSEDDRIRIAREVFTEMCREKFRADSERIFSNVAHHAVWRVVDDAFDGKAAEMIAAKVPEVIKGMSPFALFRPYGYGYAESAGEAVLKQCLRNNIDVISESIRAAAATITKADILNGMENGDFRVTLEIKQ